MNSIEPEDIEVEQRRREQSEAQTDLQVDIPAPAPEIRQGDRSNFNVDPDDAPRAETFVQQYPAEVSYSCLLIPRFPDHYLNGDITEDLAEWMRQICVSFGWRLESIVVRPGYLQWVLTVPLTANPAQVMRLTRQHTSQRIFDDYPRYKRINMSGDFWAPGHYVAPGDQLLSLESISSFTQATRKQQGIF